MRLKKETGIDAAAHLTCVAATQGEIDDVARAYWDAGIRHIVALRGDPPAGMGGKYCAASRRLRQRRRAGRRPQEDRRLPDQRRGLSREASRLGRRPGRPRQPQAQGRCRRRPLHHPVLLRGRRFPALPRRAPRRPASTCRSCRASCRSRTSRRITQDRRPVRLQGAGLAGRAVRRPRRRPRDPPHDRRHRGRRPLPPPARRRRRPVPFLHAEPRRPHLRDLPPARASPGPAEEPAAIARAPRKPTCCARSRRSAS